MPGTEPHPIETADRAPAWCLPVAIASALLGLTLIVDQAYKSSATYDEVTYLRVAARWWRSGDQAEMGRMGSPVTFFKIQQGPILLALDLLGRGAWIDDPVANQAALLPVIRIGGAWTWLAMLAIVAAWARRLYGPRAMAAASAITALGPNLLAHGTLATNEMPMAAGSAAVFFGFWTFLRTGSRRAFWATAAACGLAFSCKFTAVVLPPILALAWAIDLRRAGAGTFAIARAVIPGMIGFGAAMAATDLVLTGFAAIPLSPRSGSHPILDGKFPPAIARWAGWALAQSYPQDWVGFANQIVFQGRGGPSYLLGERRLTGWKYYYPVALALKVPLAFWLLVAARACIRHRAEPGRDDRSWMLPTVALAFLVIAMMGSKRNYGVRYLLPVAAPAIVWASALAEGRRASRAVAGLGIAGMAAALAAIHPHELSYFNEIAGGPIGGRHALADSNLDWGQGLRGLARLQRDRPELRDLTLFYFGETDPAHYGVAGRRVVFDANRTPEGLPPILTVETPFVAVSASLQFGPWGPEGYFRKLDRVEPVAYTADTTIAIYRAADIR